MKKLIALVLTLCLASTLAVPVFAANEPKGYLVLGENLNSEQQKQVLDYFEVENLDDYHVSYTTNKQEHQAFDDYLPASVIGSKSVSSILLIPKEEGSGITIHTSHITYVTKEMYQNALITSGVKDVDVYVAAPFDVSGTAALLGAMNAYGTMTGKSVDDTAADAAIDELVTTGEIADALNDKETAVQLIALLKQYLAEHGDEISDEELNDAIDKICIELKITLDDDMKAEIIALLRKLQNTNIDTETLKQQAGALYDSISGMMGLFSGVAEKAANSGFFQRLLEQIIQWFNGLFGG